MRIFYDFKVTERYLAQLLAVGLKTQITSLNLEGKNWQNFHGHAVEKKNIDF